MAGSTSATERISGRNVGFLFRREERAIASRVTCGINGRPVMRNKAEQYRSCARSCLEVARTLWPGNKRLMDRATLIDNGTDLAAIGARGRTRGKQTSLMRLDDLVVREELGFRRI
jgi:hypothetical protein